MMDELQNADRELLYALQRGLPISARPFRDVALSIGWSEDRVVARAAEFVECGLLRRFGGVFDSRRLGYRSALCAVDAPVAACEAIAAQLIPHTGITHCYLRGWPAALDPALAGAPTGRELPALWFTIATPQDSFESEVQDVHRVAGEHPLLVLPSVRQFKIDVVFDSRVHDSTSALTGSPDHSAAHEGASRPLTVPEKRLVQLLQGHLPVVAEPFADIARETGRTAEDIVEVLRRWREERVLRRLAFIARHRRLGFRANAMCVWRVDEREAAAKGSRLAAAREVTHCYQRRLHPSFPFNLFAMIHTAEWQRTHDLFMRLSEGVGLDEGRLLCSLREFKKSSMRYFETQTPQA